MKKAVLLVEGLRADEVDLAGVREVVMLWDYSGPKTEVTTSVSGGWKDPRPMTFSDWQTEGEIKVEKLYKIHPEVEKQNYCYGVRRNKNPESPNFGRIVPESVNDLKRRIREIKGYIGHIDRMIASQEFLASDTGAIIISELGYEVIDRCGRCGAVNPSHARCDDGSLHETHKEII